MKREVLERGAFEGVANIVRFNWPFYAGAMIAAGTALALTRHPGLPRWAAGSLRLGAGAAAWMLGASLAASHWIYDRSPLYRWRWLRGALPREPSRIVNVHAGFDESTAALRVLWPAADLAVLDFYDPRRSPERSIARARWQQAPARDTRRIDPAHWPVADASADLVLLCLAVHELRGAADRAAFFREVARVLATNGRAVLVEHLRDLPNFAAFGPGFLHFLPRTAWLEGLEAGGLIVEREFSITPFVRAFLLTSPP